MVSAIALKRRFRRRTLPFLAALITWLCAVFLAAPAAMAEDKTAARDHWERGTKFYDLGKYDEAIREFEAAYEAKGDPAFLYNLAQSHRLAGHAADSLRFYRTYLRYVPKAPNRSDIEDRIKELEKIIKDHPAAETATTPSAPPSTSGSPTPTAPPSVAPTPPNAPTETSGATSSPPAAGPPSGNAPTVAPPSFTPTPGTEGTTVPSDTPAGTAPAPRKSSARKTTAIAIAGIGGGLIVVGGIFGLVALNQAKKVETAATNGDRFDPSVETVGKNAQALQWLGYGLGIAGVVTGLILYATAPSQQETAAPPRVAVAPLAVPGAGGALSLHVTF
jgi:tetratricopeptide (TPR) repeat protein